AVVAEDQEARAVRSHLRERQPVQHRAHRVLADAEVQVAPPVAAGLEVARAVERQAGLRGGGEVGRAADEPRDGLGHRIEDLGRGLPSREALRVRGKGRDALLPALRKLAVLHAVEVVGQGGMARLVALEKTDPFRAQPRAARADAGRETFAYTLGDEELLLFRPAVEALAEPDLLLAQRLAVRGVGVLLVRRAVADVAVDDDQ